MSTKPKILLFGSGAIGTIYVYLLLQANCDVTAVCRSNYYIAKEKGFTIDSDLYGKGIHIQPKVVRTPEEAASEGPFDYVIVSCKALPEAKTSETIRPVVTRAHTTIILIQNGIDIEQEYATLYPTNPLLSCVVYLPTTQISPGHIQAANINNLELGPYPPLPTTTPSPQASKFIDLLNTSHPTATYYPSIQPLRWKKLLLNAPWNPICALTLCRDIPFLESSPFAENVIKGVMDEVVKLSQALGFDAITDQMAETQLQNITKSRAGTDGIEPSMLVDVLWSRKMEVEVILGNPVRIAKEKGVEVPRMEMLYVLSKGLGEAIRYRKPGKSLTGEDLRRGHAESS